MDKKNDKINRETTKAIISEKVILCGCCGHKIAEVYGLKHGLGNGTLYILCNHKSSGKKCKTINQIDL